MATKETVEIMVQNLSNQLVASGLRYFIISCAIALGFLLWNKSKPLLSFSWKRLFSYFFFAWAFNEYLSGYFLDLHGIEEKVGIFDYLGAYLHPLVYNLRTYTHLYKEPPFSVFYHDSPYAPFFQFLQVSYWSMIPPAILSVTLSLGFSLWSPKVSLKKLSIKRLLSIFFFLIAASHLISSINQFLARNSYLSAESISGLNKERTENQ